MPELSECVVQVPTAVLAQLLSSFDEPVWRGVDQGYGPADVLWALDKGQLHPERIEAADQVSLQTHIARVAYLVSTWPNDGSDPLHIDVDEFGQLCLNDGHHRLAAAITRKDASTFIEVSGYLDVAEEVLGVSIA